jgi:hypothetical protein
VKTKYANLTTNGHKDDKIIETIKSQANSLQKEKERKGRQEVESY